MTSLGPRFEVLRLLGRGDATEVWLAHDLERNRTVAIQTPLPDAPPETASRLERAHEIARWLDHPNILRVDDLVRFDGRTLLVMEAASGGNLSRFCCQPMRAVLSVAIPAARGLHFAHERGVVHRALSLRNVLLQSDGTPMIAGFGSAAEPAGRTPSSVKPGSGSRSPQQIAGEAPTAADDVFTFGALLYELLTGHPPKSSKPADFAASVLGSNDEIPQALAVLVAAALADNPQERPPDLAFVASRLESILATVSQPEGQTNDTALRPPPRVVSSDSRSAAKNTPSLRRRTGLTVLAVVLLTALAVVFLVLPDWVAEHPANATEVQPTAVARRPEPSIAPTPAESSAEPAAPTAVATRSQRQSGAGPAWRPTSTPDVPRSTFVNAMSHGLLALENGDWESAHRAFTTANSIRPGAPEVTDGLARAAAGRRRAELADLEHQGHTLEDRESWHAAVAVFTRALEIDPTALFAQQGLERSSERVKLDDRLQYHLTHRQRLTSARVHASAASLLENAQEVQPRGPRLATQLADLELALRHAASPVPVVFVSDNQTTVEILRVGALGSFEHTEIMLLPGSYVVTGSRSGYRDIRRSLEVVAGEAPAPFEVSCRERL